MITTDPQYNVECINCGCVFAPQVRSSLWWQAKKRDEQGYLDALHVNEEECGCVEPPAHPEAPIRVFGYDSLCEDFNYPFWSFTKAVQVFRSLQKDGGNTVFITGVSTAVEDRLGF